jgi:chromosome segregation ATPase
MRAALLIFAFLIVAAPAFADEQSNEDRLRDALRQSVQEMRAAQDQASQAQAQLTTAQTDLASTKAQLDAANAKLAELQGKPQAKPEELTQLQAALKQSQANADMLQQGLTKWQGAYQQAADLARAKDADSQRATAGLAADSRALETCKTTNKKLIDVAEQVLHLYQTESFRGILLRSYEPLIGTSKVTLENMVQDYDDKIRDEEYVAPAVKK